MPLASVPLPSLRLRSGHVHPYATLPDEMTTLTVDVYSDGAEPHPGWDAIRTGWAEEWVDRYSALGALRFASSRDMKPAETRRALPPRLGFISDLRNPDLYFVVMEHRLELAGLEFSTHSPDGSNIDKRFPLLWAARRYGVHGFLLTPYAKRRSGRQINRFPGRVGKRNLDVLSAHRPGDPEAGLTLTLPSRELQEGDVAAVPAAIQRHLLTFEEVGRLLAHLMAARVAPTARDAWGQPLVNHYVRLRDMSEACVAGATREAPPSTLHKDGSRWVQVYNARPETGHWERGEGQFDSIDARLMVTLDKIDLLPGSETRPRLEFWLPQMVSGHAWIREQRENDFRSKRFGNIVRVLRPDVLTKFADQLTPRDWQILFDNPGLCLERLDWPVALYRIVDLVAPKDRPRAAAGIRSAAERGAVLELLGDPSLFYASHRAYNRGWKSVLAAQLASVPRGATVLAPRLPGVLIQELAAPGVTLLPGERCTKIHLLTLRQIERRSARRIAPFEGE